MVIDMKEFQAYSLADKKKVKFEVTKKIVSNIRGHLTYNLMGKTITGRNISALVNKEQWDEFDVPIEEREINKKIDRKAKRLKVLNMTKAKDKVIPKSQRRIYNEEIENWIIEHYGLEIQETDEE